MAVSPFLSSINSGEFSPRMEARVDFERYPNAAKMCRNLILFPQGGITRRPGTRFIKEVKTSSLSTRIIPFEFNEDDSYIVEAGNNYFRFYRRQGNLTVSTTNGTITNGTFGSNITSWTDVSSGGGAIVHASSSGGRLQLTGAAGGVAAAQQTITVNSASSALTHVLKFKVATLATVGACGAKIGFQVGSTSGGSELLSEVLLGVGEHSISFSPASNTTFYIQFRNSAVPVQNIYIDNVEFISNAPMELVSPYATADLDDLRFYQAADVVYLCHPNYAVRKLERRGHTSWSIVEAFFEDGPYLEINDGRVLNDYQIITNGLFENGLQGFTDNSTGAAFVIYNEAGNFAEFDPGGAADAAIMRTSATVVSGKVHIMHVLCVAAGPVTIRAGTTVSGVGYINTTLSPGWTTFNFTTSSTTLHVEFEYNDETQSNAGIGGCLVYSESARFIEPSATTGSVTLTARGFTPFASTDIGRLIRLEWPGYEPGYAMITAYTSTTVVTALVLRKFPFAKPTESWRFGSWGGTNGYPKAVGFFDGRSGFANTEGQPSTLWLSQSANTENMRPDSFEEGASTVQDDDAINVTLRSTKINPIFWLSGQRQLMVGTAGGEWVIGSANANVTPSDISSKQHSAVPCADLRNIDINQTILFADRARREIHDLGFSLEQDSFLATDLTILADHIFRSNLEEMAYQRNPYSIVWCRRADGRLAALSYNKQHEILGWSQTIMGGVFGTGDAIVESIAVIPGSSDSGQVYPSDERNELWMIVKRTINGSTKRYIEVMEYFYEGPLREDYDTEVDWQAAMRIDQADAFYVDCGLTYKGASTTTVTGLNHLEGQEVDIVSNGKPQIRRTISGGSVSFNDAGTIVHVGLPYKHRYEGLKLAASGDGGGSINKVKIITSVGMVVLDTADFKVTTVDYDENGRRQHTLYPQEMLRDHMDPNAAVPLFTGELAPSTDGVYSRDSRIYIESENPMPFTLLCLAPQMEIRPTN